MLRRILSYASWSVIDQLVCLSVGLVVGIALARHLGPAQFGTYSIVLAILVIAGCLVPLAADPIVIRELARRPNATDRILGSQAALRSTGSLLAIAAATIGIVLQGPNLGSVEPLVYILSISFLFHPFETVGAWLNASLLGRANIIARLPIFLIMAAVRLMLIFLQAGITAFLILIPIEAALAAASLGVVYHSLGHRIALWRVNFDEMLSLFRSSWPLLLAGLSTLLYMRTDIVMLGMLADNREAGIFGVAARFSEMWYFVPTTAVMASQPIISQLRERDPARYIETLQLLYGIMFWFSFLIAVGFTLTADFIVNLLFGDHYAQAALVLKIHIWAAIPVFLGVAGSQLLIAENYVYISMWRTMIGLAANVLLNLCLIPRWGAQGAAVATVVSFAIATFSLFLFKATRGHFSILWPVFRPSWPVNAIKPLFSALKSCKS